MLKKMIIGLSVITTVIIMSSHMLSAKSYSVYLKDSDIAAYAPVDTTLGDFYTLQVDIPEIIKSKELFGAFLEFFVDASAVEKDGFMNAAPIMEVYALTRQFSGSIDTTAFDQSIAGPTMSNIVIGENRRVLIDITEIVKKYIRNPEMNNGLILGSLTGRRDGRFAIKNGIVSQGALARLKFHYDSRVKY